MNHHLAKILPVFVLVAATQAQAAVITFEDQPLGTPSNFVQDGLLIEFLGLSPSEAVIDTAGNPGQALSAYGDGPNFILRITALSGNNMFLDGFDYDVTNLSADATHIGLEAFVGGGPNEVYQDGSTTGGYQHIGPFGGQFHRLDFRIESWGDNDSVHLDNIAITIVPAPGVAALLGMGGLLAARRRR